MNILFGNDTSYYHCGCNLTCTVLKQLISKYGTITKILNCPSSSQYITDWENVNLSNIDIVIINGEGTFHSNTTGAQQIIKLAARARIRKIKVCLINTVIQNIHFFPSYFDYISCRESLSAGDFADVVPDACFCHKVNASFGVNIICTDSVISSVSNDIKKCYFPKHSKVIYQPFDEKTTYDEMLNLFKRAKLIVTGRYHGVVFAMMCGVPFLAIKSNTHKIEGLCKDFKLSKNIVTVDEIQSRIDNNDYLTPNINVDEIRADIEEMIKKCFDIN